MTARLFVLAAFALGACRSEGAGSAACGLVQTTGPFIVQQQLDQPRQILTDAPRGLPEELPARVVGQREGRVAIAYGAEQLTATYSGDGFPSDPAIGFGLLVVDDTSQRVVGLLIYDAAAPRERPRLGFVTSGERSIPLFGVRVSWDGVSNPRCPLLGDTTAARP